MARSSRLLVLLALALLLGAVVAYAVLGYVRMARQERGIATHAEEIGVRGVPFYLVGDRRLASEGDLYAALAEGVAKIRKDGCRATC